MRAVTNAPGPQSWLLPSEMAALERADRLRPTHRVVLLAFAVLLLLLPAALYLREPGHRDHILGRDQPVVAQVDSVRPDGRCGRRSRSTDHRVEVSWQLDGRPGSGSYQHCGSGAPRPGQSIQVWVGPSGYVSEHSPTYDRIGMTLVGLLFGGLLGGGGLAMQAASARRRRQVVAAAASPMLAPVPVQVVRRGRGPRVLELLGPPTGPGLAAGKLHPVLSTDPAKASATIASVPTGQWWAHHQQAPEQGSRVALLVRDQQRIWVVIGR